METLLWISIGCILYGYVGYPLLITILSVVRGRVVRKNPDYRPSVSLIIPAHNEVKVIRKKLDNALTVDYPREYLEIVVVSDESTDGTDEIVKEYDDRGIQLIRLEPRGGKNRAVNTVVPQVNGEIVVCGSFGQAVINGDSAVCSCGGRDEWIRACESAVGEE